jgi:hypothetical protein
MKHLFFILFFTFHFSAAASLIPIYRSVKGDDHLFSSSPTEGPNAGYTDEGLKFYLFSAGHPTTRPLYRCTINKWGHHFQSLDPNCEGQRVEGILGYVSTVPSDELAVLMRFSDGKLGHVDVLQGQPEVLTGWKFENIQGHVIPPPGFQKPPPPTVIDDGKKYFGYYAGAMEGIGSHPNYIPELSKQSNLIFVMDGDIEKKLNECRRLGKKAMVGTSSYFLDDQFKLKPNYARNFERNVEPILRRHLGTIAAFYILDEPYMNGIAKGQSPEEVYHNQETLGRFLKSKFPSIPIATIFTVKDVKMGYALFPSFDWFGFDCYKANLKCDGVSVAWTFEQLTDRVNQMYQADGKRRMLMAVPQAGHPVKQSSTGEKDVLVQLPHYQKFTRQNQLIKVVMPFIWQSFNNGVDDWVGARDIPSVKEAYSKFYFEFTKN